jgi:hypothetical protein
MGLLLSPLVLAGCSQTGSSTKDYGYSMGPRFVGARSASAREKECLQRAMFFESNRSSREGMIGVGTVVMNRLRSGKHGNTICAVVGEKGQFAPGVLSRPMNSRALPDVEAAAEAVLKGERHPKLKNSMFFHTAGLKFPYKNMHYVAVAGGNAFYEKRGRNWQPLPPETGTMIAMAAPERATERATAPAPTAERLSPPAPQPVQMAAATMPTPAPARFGEQPSQPQPPASPFMRASAGPSPAMAFGPSDADADAVGALIVAQNRPLQN